MKVKPFRACDICGRAYNKVNGCMKIKVKRFDQVYNDGSRIMETMDICPRCGSILLCVVKERVESLENKKRAGD